MAQPPLVVYSKDWAAAATRQAWLGTVHKAGRRLIHRLVVIGTKRVHSSFN